MYPSDYGYATSGGSTTDRATCLNTVLKNWDGSSVSDCKNNDWLFDESDIQWAISPDADSFYASGVVVMVYNGSVINGDASFSNSNAVLPVVYLTSNVKISGGEGTSESPFTLEL